MIIKIQNGESIIAVKFSKSNQIRLKFITRDIFGPLIMILESDFTNSKCQIQYGY